MSLLAMAATGLIAALHVFIAWFEIFAWERRGPGVFPGVPRDIFPKTRALAANQGLYNAFLAAGLIWSLFIADPLWAGRVATFFLACVAVAGVFGALTVSQRILRIQTLPALVGLALVWMN